MHDNNPMNAYSIMHVLLGKQFVTNFVSITFPLSMNEKTALRFYLKNFAGVAVSLIYVIAITLSHKI